jgi:hypothetical protein
MISARKRYLAEFLALVLILYPTGRASAGTPTRQAAAQEQSADAVSAPPEVVEARKVFVANGGGDNYFEMFSGGADRAYATLLQDLKRSGRYTLVDSPKAADVIFEIRAIAPTEAYGNDDVTPNPQLVLRILDPATNALLWTTSANVMVFGLQRRRDREFDSAVGVLVDKLAQTTGQPLNQQQAKAVRANSRWSMEKKILVIGAIVAGGLIGFGAYSATHMSAPAMPAMPSQPSYPFP